MKQLTHCSRVIALFSLILLFNSVFGQASMPATTIANQSKAELIYVYGETWVAQNQPMIEALEECRLNRMSFVQIPLASEDKYPLLSSYPLMNKMNPKIEALDFSQFNVGTFNPFTYDIEFLSDKAQIIRIDSTDWVMVIQPVKH